MPVALAVRVIVTSATMIPDRTGMVHTTLQDSGSTYLEPRISVAPQRSSIPRRKRAWAGTEER